MRTRDAPRNVLKPRKIAMVASTEGSFTSPAETPLQRRVFFDVLAYSSNVVAPMHRSSRAQAAASTCWRRLPPFRRARAHQRVQFVDEQDDPPLARRDLLEERLQPLLEFPRNFAPAIIALKSIATSFLFFKDSGTSRSRSAAPVPRQWPSCPRPVRRSAPGCSSSGASTPASPGGFPRPADHRIDLARPRQRGEIAPYSPGLKLVLRILVSDRWLPRNSAAPSTLRSA